MTNFDEWGNQILANAIADFQRIENERVADEARENPKAYRNTKVFDKPMNYRYYETKNKRGSCVRFCWSVNRNVAGYFLIWRETVTKKMVRRDQWDSTKDKHDAKTTSLKRWEGVGA